MEDEEFTDHSQNTTTISISSVKELMAMGVPQEEILDLCDRLYDLTDFICDDYPKHNSWFYQKHLPETLDPTSGRDIVFAQGDDQTLYGTSFIKRDETERKICTLFVSQEARGLGVGSALVERSMELLDETKPMITIADYKLDMFQGLIEKYGWEQTQVIPGAYNDHSSEIVFNGFLDTPEAPPEQ